MFIHTHGKKGLPLIVILHPMGISGEKTYEVIGRKFQGEYFFITPDMGGHGSEKRIFKSAKAEAAALHHYLVQKGLTEVCLLYGASLGSAVSLQLLKYKDLNIRHVYLDGAPVARLNAVMRNIFAPVLVWQQDMIKKDREKGISDFVKRYGRDIAEHMADSFLAFDKESIRNIGRDCVNGNMPDLSEDLQRRICFDWGEKELYTRTSKPLAEKIWPASRIIVRPGMEHCEAMAQVPDYVKKMEQMLSEADTGEENEAFQMQKLTGLSEAEVTEVSRQIADAFYAYKYSEEDTGLIKFVSTREDMFTYMNAIVQAAYKSGVLYTTSDRHEGYLMLSGEGVGSVRFMDGMRMILAEKQALGGFWKMKEFISACFCDGGSIESRMRKAGRKFIRIEMLIVRTQYQKQGYMRKMMEYTYRLAEDRGVSVILDTDDKDKASRYEHLGMTLDRIRTGGDRFHMYDLIRE